MNYAVATSNDMYSLPALMPSTTKVRFTEFPNWLPKSLVEEFYRQYGIKYTILRYGSVYSERDFDNNYIYS